MSGEIKSSPWFLPANLVARHEEVTNINPRFLCVFAQSQKATISFATSASPQPVMQLLGSYWAYFHENLNWGLLLLYVDKIQFD
jgi:hypothetical protein